VVRLYGCFGCTHESNEVDSAARGIRISLSCDLARLPREISTLSLHDALPISDSATLTPMGSSPASGRRRRNPAAVTTNPPAAGRSEEHTSELQSGGHLVCRLLVEQKKGKHRRAVSRLRSSVIQCNAGAATGSA